MPPTISRCATQARPRNADDEASQLLQNPHCTHGPLHMNERIRLDPLVNKLVRFKLHELAEMKEGIIRTFDRQGYWIEGGSLAQYLRETSPGADPTSDVQFIEYKRIQWFQKA
jgi:hypothetical protein